MSKLHRAITVRRLVVVGGAAVLLVAGVGGLAAAYSGGQPKTDKSGRATSDLVEVVKGDFDITTTCSGELKAKNQIEIRNTMEIETTIVEIVAEGTSVKQGDVLVKLNSEPIQTRLDEESLSLESTRAARVEADQGYEIQVSENESSTRQADLKLALAQLDLDQWKQGEVESKRQDLDHALDRAEKDEVRLKEKLDKSVGLEKKGYYSLDQLKQDDLAHEQAVAALEKARLDKQVYWSFQHPKDKRKKESDVEEAQAEKVRVLHLNESKIASKEADRSNKRQALVIREQKHAKAQEQLAACTVKAPRDGLVVFETSRWGGEDMPMQIGKKVTPNELLIILPDTSEMIASVKVHESLAGRIRPGLLAAVKVDAAGERRFTGKVESIGILAEQTSRWMDPNLREYTVKISLDTSSPDGVAHGLKPSMRAEAEVFLGKATDVVTIPIQAVFSDGLVRYVHTPDGSGRYLKRPVGIGQRSDRFAEARVGIKPGQQVLIRKPEPAEVLAKPWDAAELAAVGLQLNEQGTIVPIGGGPGGELGSGGMPGGSPKSRAGKSGPGAPSAVVPAAPVVERPATPPAPAGT